MALTTASDEDEMRFCYWLYWIWSLIVNHPNCHGFCRGDFIGPSALSGVTLLLGKLVPFILSSNEAYVADALCCKGWLARLMYQELSS